MAEAAGRALYSLSTPKGEPIPFEVIRPAGLITLAFTDVASAAISIPAAAELLAIYSTAEAIIAFDSVVSYSSVGTYQANHMIIPANTFMNIDHNEAATFTALGIREGGGILFVVAVTKWKDIRKSAQFDRG
jgi:hypothetical protein